MTGAVSELVSRCQYAWLLSISHLSNNQLALAYIIPIERSFLGCIYGGKGFGDNRYSLAAGGKEKVSVK